MTTEHDAAFEAAMPEPLIFRTDDSGYHASDEPEYYTRDQMRAVWDARGEALQADARRLNWMEVGDGRFNNIDRITSIVGKGFNGLKSLRAAIDAEMALDKS
jgi:hypothetical protein